MLFLLFLEFVCLWYIFWKLFSFVLLSSSLGLFSSLKLKLSFSSLVCIYKYKYWNNRDELLFIAFFSNIKEVFFHYLTRLINFYISLRVERWHIFPPFYFQFSYRFNVLLFRFSSLLSFILFSLNFILTWKNWNSFRLRWSAGKEQAAEPKPIHAYANIFKTSIEHWLPIVRHLLQLLINDRNWSIL